jgi:hypothetical protein
VSDHISIYTLSKMIIDGRNFVKSSFMCYASWSNAYTGRFPLHRCLYIHSPMIIHQGMLSAIFQYSNTIIIWK